MIILDTNVISELMKEKPDGRVENWFENLSESQFYTTVVSVSEIGTGISLLDAGKKRDSLQRKHRYIMNNLFKDRVLAFDERAAGHYPKIVSIRKRSGKPIAVMDAIIASICKQHDASLVTRNISDFENIGIELIDPWG